MRPSRPAFLDGWLPDSSTPVGVVERLPSALGNTFEAIALREIRQAFLNRASADRELAEAVEKARANGHSWASIGATLGTSGEAAPAAVSIGSKAWSIVSESGNYSNVIQVVNAKLGFSRLESKSRCNH